MLRRMLDGFLSLFDDAPAGPLSPTRAAGDELQVEVIGDEPRDPMMRPQYGTQALRNRLLNTQYAEEVQSRTVQRTFILPAGEVNPVSEERRSFTDEGLVTYRDEYLLATADGRLVRGPELHGGGCCASCRQYASQLYFCFVCRRPVCITHAIPWENGVACPEHHQWLIFNQDTWPSK